MKSGNPSFSIRNTAAILAAVLTALLPVKFASIVSVPEMPASYWFDIWSILLTAWPVHLFSFCSALLLLLAVPYRKFAPQCRSAYLWTAALLVMTLLSLCGWVHASCREYALQMISYAFGCCCYGAALYFLLERDPGFRRLLLGAVCTGAFLSMCSGLYQYFYGFEALRQHVYEQNLRSDIPQITGQFLNRIRESRLQADFSVCNTYGGYLAFMLSVFFASVWIYARNRVRPEKLSPWILSLPAAAVILFLIVQTGSRGAFFSLCAACTMLIFALPLNRKMRLAAAGAVLLMIGGLISFAALGRGFKSMTFRFDYDYAAFRMMLSHPLCGTGWGDFFHDYQILKLLLDEEAPHTPHNMPLLFGSQAGIPAFLAACAVLFYPVFHGFRSVRTAYSRSFPVYALLFALTACAADSLLEISYETPAFFGTFTALSLILFFETRDGGKAEPSPAPQGKFRMVFPAVFAASALFSAVFALYMIRAERSFSILQEHVDIRFSRDAAFNKDYRPAPPEQVMEMMRQAADDGPYNPFVWATGCDYAMSRGDLFLAEHLMDEAIRRSPSRAAFYLRRAQIRYFRTGDLSLCREDLARARELFPMNQNYRVPDEELIHINTIRKQGEEAL